MKDFYQCIVAFLLLLVASLPSAALAAAAPADEDATLRIHYHVDAWAELEVKGDAVIAFNPQTHILSKSFQIVSKTNVQNAIILAQFSGDLINTEDKTKKISYTVKHNSKSFAGSSEGVPLIENPSIGEQTHTVQIELDLQDSEAASLGDYKGNLTLQIAAA